MPISQLKFSQGQFAGQDVSSLPNRPGESGVTPAQLKARFDNVGKTMVALGGFNKLIDALMAQTGAGEIGATVSGLTGNNVGALLAALKAYEDSHRQNTANPHAVTKAQVGLGNADNTADKNKPVSTAQAAAIAAVKSTADQATSAARTAQMTAEQAQAQAQDARNQADSAVAQAQDAKATAKSAYDVAAGIAKTAHDAKVAAQNAHNIAVEAAKTAQDAIFISGQAKELAKAATMAYDPVTGRLAPVSEALRSIYELVKSAPMTAGDFAANTITVDFFKSKNMTVSEFATRGRQILIGG